MYLNNYQSLIPNSNLQEIFEKFPQLQNLANNPLLLTLICKSFEEILKELEENRKTKQAILSITKAMIYKNAIKAWFNRESERIINYNRKYNFQSWKLKSLPPQVAFNIYCQKLGFKLLEKKNTDNKEEGIEYQELQITAENYQQYINDEVDDSQFDELHEFFKCEDTNIEDAKLSSPLRYKSNRYSFYHNSFMEYFAALYIFNNLFYDKRLESDIKSIDLINKPLNTKLITKESEIMRFLADMLENDERRFEILLSIVGNSKPPPVGQGHEVSIAAANAITLLKYARYNFSFCDLRFTDIKDADLSNIFCFKTDFTGANLTRVNFTNAHLENTLFNHCNMTDVNFGEYPSLRSGQCPVMGITYSPDGKQLAVATGKYIELWSTKKFEFVKRISINNTSGYIGGITYNKEAKIYFGDQSGHVCKLNLQQNTGDLLDEHTTDEVAIPIRFIAVGFDDQFLIALNENYISRLYYSFNPLEFFNFAGCNSSIIHPKKPQLAIGTTDGMVKLIDVDLETMELIIKELFYEKSKAHDTKVQCLAYSKEGTKLASGSSDESVIIWNIEQDSGHRKINCGPGSICNVAFDPDGTRLAVGKNWYANSVLIVDVQSGVVLCNIRIPGDNGYVTGLSFNPKFSQLAISYLTYPEIRIINYNNLQLFSNQVKNKSAVKRVKFSHSGLLIASCGSDGSVYLWNKHGDQLAEFHRHEGYVSSLSFDSADQYLASAGHDGIIRIWDIKQLKLYKEAKGTQENIHKIEFITNQKLLSMDQEGHIILFDINESEPQILASFKSCSANSGEIQCIYNATLSQIMYLSGAFPWKKVFIKYMLSETITEISGFGYIDDTTNMYLSYTPTFPIRYSVSGIIVITFQAENNYCVKVWDEKKLLVEFFTQQKVFDVIFSPDEDDLVIVSENSIQIIELNNLRCSGFSHDVKPMTGITGKNLNFSAAIFNPYYKNLFIVHGFNKQQFWMFELTRKSERKIIYQRYPCDVSITDTAFSPDGKILLISGFDGVIQWWNIIENDKLDAVLFYSTGSTMLDCSNLSIEGTEDLSPMNEKLLKQKGAIGEKIPSTFSFFNPQRIINYENLFGQFINNEKLVLNIFGFFSDITLIRDAPRVNKDWYRTVYRYELAEQRIHLRERIKLDIQRNKINSERLSEPSNTNSEYKINADFVF